MGASSTARHGNENYNASMRNVQCLSVPDGASGTSCTSSVGGLFVADLLLQIASHLQMAFQFRQVLGCERLDVRVFGVG